MIPRFHAPGDFATGEEVVLPREEGQHLTRVLRLGVGAQVRVFDGRGHEFDAIVLRDGRGEVAVTLGAARVPSAREPRVAITLAQAVLKGDRMDQVIRDAVMLGVAAVQPLVSTRTEVALAALIRAGRRERWERVAIASAKQCGRAVVPTVLEPCSFDRFTEQADGIPEAPAGVKTRPTSEVLMCVEPSAAAEVATIASLDSHPPSVAWLVVGPEGGWTTDELHHPAGRWRFVQLGTRTLRADAAALVALTALLTTWREL